MNPSQTQEAPKKSFFKRAINGVSNAAGIKVVPSIQTVPEQNAAPDPNIASPDLTETVKINTTPVDFEAVADRSATPVPLPAAEVNLPPAQPPVSQEVSPVPPTPMPEQNNVPVDISQVSDPNHLAPPEVISDEKPTGEQIYNSPDSPPLESKTVALSPPEELDQPAAEAPPPAPVQSVDVVQSPLPPLETPPINNPAPEPVIVPAAPQNQVDNTQSTGPANPELETVPEAQVPMNLVKDRIFWANPRTFLTPEGRLDKEKLETEVRLVEQQNLLKDNPELAFDLEKEGITIPKAA